MDRLIIILNIIGLRLLQIMYHLLLLALIILFSPFALLFKEFFVKYINTIMEESEL